MTMNRRVSALEAIAERARAGEILAICQRRGLVGDLEHILELDRWMRRLAAEGKSYREILEAVAGRYGADPDELERRSEQLRAKHGGGRRGAPARARRPIVHRGRLEDTNAGGGGR